MSIFNLFNKGVNFDEGVELAKNSEEAVLIDVRTKEEYKSGHIPGSINMPLNQIEKIEIEKTKPLYVYCLSGSRSRSACSYLKKQGYEVTNIGGIAGYKGRIVK
jgi:phage shock protein E